MAGRWSQSNVPRGDRYDQRWSDLAAAGHEVHGEADFVDAFGPGSVLDAGCGTGRVALELARRGHDVAGLDVDPEMLVVARRKAPDLHWVDGDLAAPGLDLGRRFDVVVMAGNVLLFVDPGTEGAVIANMARHLNVGGRLVAGYSLTPHGFGVAAHDRLAVPAGLDLEARWSTWERAPFTESASYAVSVHRRTA